METWVWKLEAQRGGDNWWGGQRAPPSPAPPPPPPSAHLGLGSCHLWALLLGSQECGSSERLGSFGYSKNSTYSLWIPKETLCPYPLGRHRVTLALRPGAQPAASLGTRTVIYVKHRSTPAFRRLPSPTRCRPPAALPWDIAIGRVETPQSSLKAKPLRGSRRFCACVCVFKWGPTSRISSGALQSFAHRHAFPGCCGCLRQ